MSEMSTHLKEILLVEDRELFSTPITRWLDEEGYRVKLAQSYDEALSALDEGHYHLAIVDIRLEDEDEDNKQGIDLLGEIKKRQLKDVMPCIMLTAYAEVDSILTATQEYGVARYIQKKPSGYRSELLNAVRELFEDEIQINFSLIYDGNSDKLIPEIAQYINWSAVSRPQSFLLPPQVRDLLGKLFVKAKRAFLSKLNPGLTGTAVVRAQPTWEHGIGPSYVAKIGPRDKIERESERYKEYVSQYLPHGTVTQVNAKYTRHIGAILYTFATGSQEKPLDEFDKFYKRNQPNAIAVSLRSLFENTCSYWYDHRERIITNLPQLYYEAFELTDDPGKLVGRIRIILPQFDPERETFQLEQPSFKAINPIAWLTQHQDECTLGVYHSITHGDLTGRNIMVNEEGNCWLIDFYRTRDSHILRDFVILETDIKYRLLPTPNWKDFLLLEHALLETSQTESSFGLENLPTDVQKAAQVIRTLRDIARKISRGHVTSTEDSHKEHLISLLMGTLNVARLRHIDENRKLQAMLSAALICAELDKLADREPVGPNVDDYLTLLAQDESAGENEGDKPVTTESLSPPRSIKAQQRHLAEQLGSNDLILFMGSAKPSEAEDWPTLEDLARQLMKEIDYDSPSRDIPRKQFAIYQNRIKAGRGHLIDKLVQYFESYLPPPFFTKVADFNWHSIYTTNQHTYLEDAYERRNQAQYQVVVSPPQRMDVSADKMPIYKLYGCLSKEHRREPSTTLPITDYDHRALNTQERIQQLTSKLEQDLAAGKSLLVLYPSETELDMAFRWRQSAKGDGLVWITGADHSEEDQDHYRHLGFRVLPDDPSDLLSDFSAFVQS